MIYDKITPTISEDASELIRKVILFDPAEIYSRLTIKPFKRHQSIAIDYIFPSPKDGTCACGCGTKLKGRQTRWSSEKCQKFPVYILKILIGDLQLIRGIMQYFHPYECCECHCEPYVIESNFASGIQVDHIVSIKDGGGGCWLGNYRFICHKCHSKKTAKDHHTRKQQKQKQHAIPFERLPA